MPAPRSEAERAPLALSAVMRGRDNAYGLIRLVLASAVIVDHAFPIAGHGEDPLWRLTKGQNSIGGLAVEGFFVVSGFLIARSAMTADTIQFLWRRVLRIFPAYWLVLVVSALVIAPAFFYRAHGSLSGFWTTALPGPLTYITHNWSLHIGQYGLLDVFAKTPYGHQIGWSILNGSLWTLEYEFRCYLLVGALALFAIFTRARVLVPIAAGGLLVLGPLATAVPHLASQMAPWLGNTQFVTLAAAFLLGSTAAVYADRLPMDGRLALGGLLVGIGTLFFKGGYHLVGVPALAYALLWFAYRAPAGLRRVCATNDYSYGIYVWGFIVQMALAELGVHKLGLIPFIVVSWCVTFVFAFASWHLVEKHALRLKSWGPGQGLAHWRDRLSRPRRAALEPAAHEVGGGEPSAEPPTGRESIPTAATTGHAPEVSSTSATITRA